MKPQPGEPITCVCDTQRGGLRPVRGHVVADTRTRWDVLATEFMWVTDNVPEWAPPHRPGELMRSVVSAEGTHWIRGHVLPDSPEGRALVAAYRLSQ
jgi:hypothetical protein